MAGDELDHDKMKRLWDDYHFRVAAIQRLYPGARVRNCLGGVPWDSGAEEYVLVILPGGEEHHNVIYEESLTKIMRSIHRIMRPFIEEGLKKHPIDPESLPMKMRAAMTAFAAAATSAETWTDEVQALWKKFTHAE